MSCGLVVLGLVPLALVEDGTCGYHTHRYEKGDRNKLQPDKSLAYYIDNG